MLDLLGFWTAVTVFTLPMLFVFSIVMIIVTNCTVHWATRGRCQDFCCKVPVLNKVIAWIEASNDGLFTLAFCLGVAEVILGMVISVDNGISIVQLVAVLSEATAPFFSGIGILALFVIAIRVISDAYYKIADKLEKLESK